MKVSIITPSFNQGQFLERTLQSVANQSKPGIEIEHIIVDGGSTDESLEILKYFTPPVRWVSKKDKGQTDAVNQGILATDGEIIGWLNSDDVYYSGAIARVVDFFNSNPDIDVVYGMADHIDIDDHAFEAYPAEPWNFERLKEICFICQPALFFRRRVVAKCGLLDESLNYCMDYEYWLRLGMNGVRFSFLKEKLAGSRLYPENKTMSSRIAVHKEVNDMFKKKFGRVPDKWIIAYSDFVVNNKKDATNNTIIKLINTCIYIVIYSLKWNNKVPFSIITIVMNLTSHKLAKFLHEALEQK